MVVWDEGVKGALFCNYATQKLVRFRGRHPLLMVLAKWLSIQRVEIHSNIEFSIYYTYIRPVTLYILTQKRYNIR